MWKEMINFDEKRGRLYRISEASTILGVHPNTIRRWERQEKIKTIRVGKGHRRIPESEISRILHKPTEIPPTTPHELLTKEDELSTFLNFVFSRHRDDPELVKKAIIVRDKYSCQICGSKASLDVYPIDQTKENIPQNLITLCPKCRFKIQAPAALQAEKAFISPQITDKPEIIQQITEKTPQEVQLPVKTGVYRHVVLDALQPAGFMQRTAFGDLLSAAAALKRFTVKELAAKGKCPEQTAQIFCDKMVALGYATSSDGTFDITTEVIA
jgi:excisionase family DNA binding protein